MMSEEDKKIVEFVDELCQEATLAVQGGDMALVNRIGGNPALNYYLVNVSKLGRMTKEDYASSTHMMEARRVYNSYQQDVVQDQRMTTIESQLAQLLTAVQALTEAKAEPAKPAKPNGKAKAAAQDTEEESAE